MDAGATEPLPRTMRALVKETAAPGAALREVPVPEPGPGELLAAETHLVDWTCYQCRTGRANVCQNLRILGVHAAGSFAQYAVIPETNAWVSEGLAPEA